MEICDDKRIIRGKDAKKNFAKKILIESTKKIIRKTI